MQTSRAAFIFALHRAHDNGALQLIRECIDVGLVVFEMPISAPCAHVAIAMVVEGAKSDRRLHINAKQNTSGMNWKNNGVSYGR